MSNIYHIVLVLVLCFPFNTLAVDAIPEGVDSLVAVIPIFSQKVSFTLPTGWKPAFEDQQSGSYMIEFIPQGEEIEDWKNLFTVQGFENLADNITPEGFLDGLAGRFKGACRDDLVYEKLERATITGYQAYLAIIGCSKIQNPQGINVSEIGYYIAINGTYDIYLIHKSIRGDAFKSVNSPLNKNTAQSFIKDFVPIKICQGGGNVNECVY